MAQIPAPVNSPAEIQRQFRKMFPRYAGDPAKDLEESGLALDKLDDAEMLVFWLGGVRENAASRKLIGFSRNPSAPLDRSNPGGALFDFDPARLVDVDHDQWLEYQTLQLGGSRGIYKLRRDDVTALGRVVVSGIQIDDPMRTHPGKESGS